MSAPRITLWTDPFKMPLRMSIRPFNERRLDKQAVDIQKNSPRIIEITPGALFILSSLAGRRMTEPARWILFDSLRDILNGHLRTCTPERQDLLASTFGELLGAVLLAFHLGGNVEVIRLLESNYATTPDFILLQSIPTGQMAAHILECKGRVEDLYNVNEHTSPGGEFDLCQELRRPRAKAMAQIKGIDFSQVKAGSRFAFQQNTIPFGIARFAATKNALISSIPDGRIVPFCSPTVRFARRKQCHPQVTCGICMANRTTAPSEANVISVLYQEKIGMNSVLGQELAEFIVRYQAAQRAVWSGNDPFFARSLSNFIEAFPVESLRDFTSSTVFMAITLIEAAIAGELTHFDLNVQRLDTIASEALHGILNEVSGRYGYAQQASRIRIEPENVQRQSGLGDASRGEPRQWYEIDPGFTRMIDFAQEYRETKLLILATFRGDDIYGSAQYEDPSTIIIRLASAATNFSLLKTYVQGLIARLRARNIEELPWRLEQFKEEGREPLLVGESWDEYPYPHPTNEALPGITAWLAKDGRAEIIVRKQNWQQ